MLKLYILSGSSLFAFRYSLRGWSFVNGDGKQSRVGSGNFGHQLNSDSALYSVTRVYVHRVIYRRDPIVPGGHMQRDNANRSTTTTALFSSYY